MVLTRQQKELVKAVRQGDVKKVVDLIDNGCDPDFSPFSEVMPLHDAVRAGNLTMVRVLVNRGADISRMDRNFEFPLDVAEAAGHTHIVRYLKDKYVRQKEYDFFDMPLARGNNGGTVKKKKRKKKPVRDPNKPVFTEKNLSKIFNASDWVGKVDEMEKLWESVPKRLQKKFNFAASFAEAKRGTIRQYFPSKKTLPPSSVKKNTKAEPPAP